MIARGSSTYRPASPRRGLTLVEMVISMVLVSIAMVAALKAVGVSKLAQFKVGVSRQGHLLAQDLMTEILRQDYADPDLGLDSFGLGATKAATGDRSLFDDVDDYDGWSATPPQYKDGTDFVGLDDWERSVVVAWVDPSDPSQIVGGNAGAKRITVSVEHNGVPAAELVALKTIGLPPLEACCFKDGSCEDLRVEACATEGGTAQGPKTNCATTECPTGPEVLFVTGGTCYMLEGQEQPVCTPMEQEAPRITLMESWGFTVTLINHNALQSDFDAALPEADVAYVGPSISGGALAHKLTGKSIGIVNEFPGKLDNFGLSSGTFAYVTGDTVLVIDDSHYITSIFSVGSITVSAVPFEMSIASGTLAPDLQNLAEISGQPAVCALETGGQRFDGGSAPARRVHLPYVSAAVSSLTADAQTIMKRSIEWAAAMETVCGDGDCVAGEECDCSADCGMPVAFEQPGATCDDGLDNDCDGVTDCDDINCPADPACTAPVCGDGTCGAGEDRCGCPEDCGTPPAWEDPGTMCADGLDNDCDGQVDCADANCTTDPTCCEPKGSHCIMNSECCSGDCNAGKNECK